MLTAVRANDGRGNTIETVSYGYEWVWQGDEMPAYSAYLAHAYYDDTAVATYTYVAANNHAPPGSSYGSIIPRVLHTCDDPRYAGPMKFIEYEYVPWTEVDTVGRGQVKAEKNVAGQVVSRTTYPTSNTDPNLMKRTESRGDGPSRTFDYAVIGYGVWSTIWRDFKNQPFTTSYPANLNGWTTTDARSNTTTYERDPIVDAVRKITYPATSDNGVTTKEYTFDSNNPYLHSGEKDENGHWTYFDRDPTNPDPKKRGQLRQIRYPDGSTEEFTYNNFGQVLTHKLRTVGTENFQYYPDNRGLKWKYWPPPTPSDLEPAAHPTVYTYYGNEGNRPDRIDRLKTVTDPRGHTTTYDYNKRGQITRVTHHDNTFTQSAYNPMPDGTRTGPDGTLAWTADENHPGAATDPNQRTRFTYDEYKRVLTVTNPMGETTTNWYGLDSNWQNPLLHTTNSVKYTNSPMNKNVVYAYDENLRRTHQAVAMGTADEAWTIFEYDQVGNLIKTTDPRSHETRFGYDQRNRRISMDNAMPGDRNSTGHTMNRKYDGVGNKLKETRADSAFRSWEYDIPNRITRAIDWRMSTSEPAITTTYARNVTSTIETTTDAKGAEYKFEFDALHRKIRETYPPAAGNSSPFERFWYDPAGNLIQYQNPAGQTKHLSYDNRNRLWDTWWDGNVGQFTSTRYDNASRVISVTTMRNNVFETSVTFGYDAANRQVWEEQTLAGYPVRRVETPRDADGNRASLNVPGWFMVRYDYTNRNQLDHIYGGGGTPWFDYTYDVAGNLLKRQDVLLGVNDSINIPPQWYDPVNRPVMWENTKAGDAFLSRSWYQYDKVGREVATWRDEQGGKGERFYYATTSQLTNVRYSADQVSTGSPVNWDRWVDYGYTPDRLNRWYVNDNANFSWVGANALNQSTSMGALGIGYDDRFNLAAYDGATFVHDATNLLVSATGPGQSVQFVYDGVGRCVKRTINGVTQVIAYDGWKPTVEWDGAGSFWAYNVYGAGPDEILWRYDSRPGYGHLRYHHDRHGNVTSLLNEYGSIIEKYSYDAFGIPKVTDPAGNDRKIGGRYASWYANRFLFQGREFIHEFGIYDYRHRYYQPALGRFLETDPTGFDGGDMNLFRYCDDDPVDGTDPTGLQSTATGSTIEERQRLFHGDNPGQQSLQELDSRGGQRAIPREQAEKEMSPSQPLSESNRALLNNGCNGMTSVFQGKGEKWPENADGTKAYLEEPQAHARVVGNSQRNFVFAKQGIWRTTRPKPDPKTGEVPRNSITSDSRFNYVVYMPSTRSYVWMDHGAVHGEQKVYISPVAPGNNLTYPRTVWFSTPIDK